MSSSIRDAFLMDEKGRWSAAPAFDLTYSNLPEHALLVGSSSKSPGLTDMLEVARHVRIDDKRTKEIVDRVRAAVADWKIHAKEANVASALIREIDTSLNTREKRAGSEVGQAAFTGW